MFAIKDSPPLLDSNDAISFASGAQYDGTMLQTRVAPSKYAWYIEWYCGLQNAMTSSEERTSAEAEGYRIERALMDCVALPF